MARRLSRALTWRILRRFAGYLQPYRWQFALIFLLLLAATGLEIARPYLIGKVIDLAATGRAWGKILALLGLFAAVVALRVGALLCRNYLLQRSGIRVTCDVRVAIFSHLQKLSLRFYDERQTGKIVARVTSDTNSMHNMVTAASVNLLGDITTMAGVLVVLLLVNWKLALLTYAILPLFVFNFLWHRRRLRVETRRHRRNWDKVVGFLNERVASSKIIKAFATEDVETADFSTRIENDFWHYQRVVWRNSLLSSGAESIGGLGTLLVLGLGSWMTVRRSGGFTIGDLVAFNFYLALLYAPAIRIIEANAIIQQAVVALEKIFAVLDTQPAVPQNEQLPNLPDVRGEVRFEQVSFGYRAHQATLSSVNLLVEPGKMVALVGPSGAGKSTIITLLARFYEPLAGRILIDGQDIRHFNVQSLRRQIGIVMQENILFSGSIADNIKYGRHGASDQEMIAAAEAANADEFIRELPHGYHSVIGEHGVTLSGGQRQRVAIARVILKNPRILILDEATSALDTRSERLIQEALERLMVSRTSIVIAHRLSTIVKADQILVMQAGSIVEQGQHEELMRRGGLYSTLHGMAQNAVVATAR